LLEEILNLGLGHLNLRTLFLTHAATVALTGRRIELSRAGAM
jgi:hypothetical protein